MAATSPLVVSASSRLTRLLLEAVRRQMRVQGLSVDDCSDDSVLLGALSFAQLFEPVDLQVVEWRWVSEQL